MNNGASPSLFFIFNFYHIFFSPLISIFLSIALFSGLITGNFKLKLIFRNHNIILFLEHLQKNQSNHTYIHTCQLHGNINIIKFLNL
jgi:hypothetical protein